MELDVMLVILLGLIIFAFYCASVICLMILLKQSIFQFLESEEGLIGLLPILAVIALQVQLCCCLPLSLYETVALTSTICVMLNEVNKLK